MHSNNPKRLNKNQRYERILHLLKIKPVVLISELSQEFNVSIETIRRDFDSLAEQSLVQRTHGGATTMSTAKEGTLNQRKSIFPEARMNIAKKADMWVKDGEVLMMDSSVTCIFLADQLAITKKELTVITNSFSIANAISTNPTHQIIMLPGQYRASESSCYGADTLASVQKFNADHCFSSCGAITSEGITEYYQEVAALKREMIKRARKTTLLADHSKFGLGKLERVCGFDVIDHLITDQDVPQPTQENLHLNQVQLTVV